MWILNWLPDIVFHLILITGVLAIIAGLVLRMVPLINKYALPIQVAGILLTVIGVWYEGGMAKDTEWKAKVAEVEKKVAEAEAKSAKVNTTIVTKIVKKLELVRTRGNDVIQYVDREIVKYDTVCPIPAEVVKAHNMAAERVSEEKK
jgi:hypothetical protein